MSAPLDRAGVVRVMAQSACCPGKPCGNPDGCPARVPAHWSNHKARLQLAALEAAGLRVVPVEATEEMAESISRMVLTFRGKGIPNEWARAMHSASLAASPFAPQQQETQE